MPSCLIPPLYHHTTISFRHLSYTFVYCLYVLIISSTRFRLNPHSIVAWMSRNSLHDIWGLSDCNGTQTQKHIVQRLTLNSSIFIEESKTKCFCFDLIFTGVLLETGGLRLNLSVYQICWLRNYTGDWKRIKKIRE